MITRAPVFVVIGRLVIACVQLSRLGVENPLYLRLELDKRCQACMMAKTGRAESLRCPVLPLACGADAMTCPFSVGDIVRFTPSERTVGHYQDIGHFGVAIGQELPIENIKDNMYIYFENGAGGWPWNEFTLVRKEDTARKASSMKPRQEERLANKLVIASSGTVAATGAHRGAAGAGRAGRGGGPLRLGRILLCRASQPAHAESLSAGGEGGSWPGPRGRGSSWRRSRRAWSASTSSAWAGRPPSGTSTWRRYAASSTGWSTGMSSSSTRRRRSRA